jgi:hypothetical protein
LSAAAAIRWYLQVFVVRVRVKDMVRVRVVCCCSDSLVPSVFGVRVRVRVRVVCCCSDVLVPSVFGRNLQCEPAKGTLERNAIGLTPARASSGAKA